MTTDRITRDQALERIRAHVREYRPQTAVLPLSEAHGLVCAQDLFAAHASPTEARSTVDGYALHSRDAKGASPKSPVALAYGGEIRPSTSVSPALEAGTARRILTGGALPQGADGVVRDEDVEAHGGTITLTQEVKPGLNVRQPGSDIRAGSRIVRRGDELSPQVLATLAVSGVLKATVNLPPQATVLAIGNELSDLETPPGPGHFPADNLLLVDGLLRLRGARNTSAQACANDPSVIAELLDRHASAGCIVTTGGTGPGDRDFIMRSCLSAGFTPLFDGLTLMPGKSMFAAVKGPTLLFAMPGNPQAVFSLMHAIVLPALCWLRGRTVPVPIPLLAKPLTMPAPPQNGWERLVPCSIAPHMAELHVKPMTDKNGESRLDLLATQGLLLIGAQAAENEYVPMIPIWENRRGQRLV